MLVEYVYYRYSICKPLYHNVVQGNSHVYSNKIILIYYYVYRKQITEGLVWLHINKLYMNN